MNRQEQEPCQGLRLSAPRTIQAGQKCLGVIQDRRGRQSRCFRKTRRNTVGIAPPAQAAVRRQPAYDDGNLPRFRAGQNGPLHITQHQPQFRQGVGSLPDPENTAAGNLFAVPERAAEIPQQKIQGRFTTALERRHVFQKIAFAAQIRKGVLCSCKDAAAIVFTGRHPFARKGDNDVAPPPKGQDDLPGKAVELIEPGKADIFPGQLLRCFRFRQRPEHGERFPVKHFQVIQAHFPVLAMFSLHVRAVRLINGADGVILAAQFPGPRQACSALRIPVPEGSLQLFPRHMGPPQLADQGHQGRQKALFPGQGLETGCFSILLPQQLRQQFFHNQFLRLAADQLPLSLFRPQAPQHLVDQVFEIGCVDMVFARLVDQFAGRGHEQGGTILFPGSLRQQQVRAAATGRDAVQNQFSHSFPP